MRESENSTPSIAIIGAGLTGLSCAYHLEKSGFTAQIFEKSSRPGGRIGSDVVDGFILDRGFQVVLSSYPEIIDLFDMTTLGCQYFDSGAYIHHPRKGWLPIYNPRFHFLGWMKSILRYPSQFLSFIRLFQEYHRFQEDPRHWKFGILSTEELLHHLHIPNELIELFFRPFFGGVFLENELHTQAPIFMERFHHFFNGKACLPAEGMSAIPLHLAEKLKSSRIHYQKEAVHVDNHLIKFADGSELHPDITICCIDSKVANQLFPMIPCHQMLSVACLYFSINADNIHPHRLLMLGSPDGPINNLSIDSAVQPTYAPEGKHLISASVVDQKWQKSQDLAKKVGEQIHKWLGAHPEHLRTYSIEAALPTQNHPPPLLDYHHPRHKHVYLAGELVDSASINGALYSGKRIAQKIISDLAMEHSKTIADITQ
jgi:phytoene dehydrogenase-like protein